MKLSAVTLARVVALVEPVDLNPQGRIHYPDLAAAFVKRYSFLKFPQKAEDFDESKGVLFEGGKIENVPNIRLQIFSYGVVIDTGSSTEDCNKVLEDALTWGAKELGFAYKPEMIKRRGYVSQLTFFSDIDLANLHRALAKLSARLTTRVPQFFGLPTKYEPTAIIVGMDALSIKAPPAPFTIERRLDVPFSENKYFSSAPLPTSEHITVLKEFEADILSPR